MNPATPTIRAHTRGDTTRHDKSIRVRGNSTADGLSDAPSIPHQQSGTEEKTASLEKSAKPHGRKTEAASSIASIGEDSPSESKIEASDGASGPAGNEMLLLGYPALNSLDGADIPDYIKEHNATLTFPEMLMLMLMYMEREYAKSGRKIETVPVAWMPDGNAFVIRSKEKFVSDLLPQFFRQSKFSSFTRKLYRWGFRQVNIPRERLPKEMYFGNEYFQRDNKALLAQMRSITAAGLRREKAAETAKKSNQGEFPAASSDESQEPSGFMMPGMFGQDPSSLAGLPVSVMNNAAFTGLRPYQHQQSASQDAMYQQIIVSAQLQLVMQQQASFQHQDLIAQLSAGTNLSASLNIHMQLPQLRGSPPGFAPNSSYLPSMELQRALVERERLRNAVDLLLRQPPHSPP